jgi:hypothetical protein
MQQRGEGNKRRKEQRSKTREIEEGKSKRKR